MSLSPYNGECATWLIMCFQNSKFSDDRKEGHRAPTEAGRKGEAHVSTGRLQTWKGSPGLQLLQHAACAIRGPRLNPARRDGEGRWKETLTIQMPCISLLATELVFE